MKDFTLTRDDLAAIAADLKEHTPEERKTMRAWVPTDLMAGAEGFWERGYDYTDPDTYSCRDWEGINEHDFARACILIDLVMSDEEVA